MASTGVALANTTAQAGHGRFDIDARAAVRDARRADRRGEWDARARAGGSRYEPSPSAPRAAATLAEVAIRE